MSDLKARIQGDIKTAMKAKEAEKLQTLRNVWNAIRKKEIDSREDVDNAQVEKLLMNMQKQINESLEQAKKAGRDDLVAENQAELNVLQDYLPKALSPDELQSIVKEVISGLDLPEGNAGMGMAMKSVMAKVGAQADGKSVQACVRKVLGL